MTSIQLEKAAKKLVLRQLNQNRKKSKKLLEKNLSPMWWLFLKKELAKARAKLVEGTRK